MTSKTPEVRLNTSLNSISKFVRAIVLVLALLGVGAGGTAAYNKYSQPTIEEQYSESHCSLEFEKKLSEYNSRLTKVETRMDNTDMNIVEIKASLVRIETFLMYGKNENK